MDGRLRRVTPQTCRKDFTPTEAVEHGRRLEELEKPKAKERLQAGANATNKALGRKHDGDACAESAQASQGKTRDIVAHAVDGTRPPGARGPEPELPRVVGVRHRRPWLMVLWALLIPATVLSLIVAGVQGGNTVERMSNMVHAGVTIVAGFVVVFAIDRASDLDGH